MDRLSRFTGGFLKKKTPDKRTLHDAPDTPRNQIIADLSRKLSRMPEFPRKSMGLIVSSEVNISTGNLLMTIKKVVASQVWVVGTVELPWWLSSNLHSTLLTRAVIRTPLASSQVVLLAVA
jgi:hypothetical protein